MSSTSWIEPPTLSNKPKEYKPNINAYGTWLAMTPLGTMPTAKQKKQADAQLLAATHDGRRPAKRARRSVSRSSPAVSRDSPAPIETIEEELLPIDTREEDDDDYAPASSFTPAIHRRSIRPHSSVQGETSPEQRNMSPATPTMSVSATHDTMMQDNQEDIAETLEETVNQAVQRALHQGRYPTAYALRSLFDEFRSPQVTKITGLYASIISNTASTAQIEDFNNLMKFKKREGRREDSFPTRARARFATEIAAIQENCAALAALSSSLNPAPTFQEESSTMDSTPLFSTASPQIPMSHTPIVHATNHAFDSGTLSPSRKALVDRVSRFGKFNSTNGDHKETSYKSPFTPIPGQTVIDGVSFGIKEMAATNALGLPSTIPRPHAKQAKVASPTYSRARSVSSTSSLSSIDEDVLKDGLRDSLNSAFVRNEEIKRESTTSHSPYPSRDLDPGYRKSYANNTAKPSSDSNLASTSSGNKFRPVIHNKSRGLPHFGVFNSAPNSNLSSSVSTSATPMATLSPYSEPTFFLPPASSHSISQQPSKSHQTTLKFKKQPIPAATVPVETLDKYADLKRKAFAITESSDSIQSSSVRKRVRSVHPDAVRNDEDPSTSISALPTLQVPVGKQTLRIRPPKSYAAAAAAKEELAVASSPTLLSFQEHLALPSSPPISRASTPRLDGRPARNNNVKGKGPGPRTKISPVKNRQSTGLRASSRAGSERDSPVPASNGQDDNDDFCTACGEAGNLICCDGCTRSFHFRCVDPKDGDDLPENWFCQVCISSRGPPLIEGSGPWAKLIVLNDASNPKAFRLPKAIREYFEGVVTGKNGEYEDAAEAVVVSKAKNRGGYDELPDWTKLKDAKGNHIICYHCHQGPVRDPSSGINVMAGGNPATRELASCSVCPHSWHLDCLDPPMARAPSVKRGWKCPLHVDDLLALVPAALGPAHRFRRIKNSKSIVPDIPRGTKNNGHIEVDLDDFDNEDTYEHGYDLNGQVYRLPGEAIQLDFMAKCRSLPDPPPMTVRPIGEAQAALNLAHFAGSVGSVIDTSGLINTLLAEAPPAVISMIAMGDASELARTQTVPSISLNDNGQLPAKKRKIHMSRSQVQSLRAMKALIEAQLAAVAANDNVDQEMIDSDANAPNPGDDRGVGVKDEEDL